MADVVWDQAVYDSAYQRWHPGFQQYVASYRAGLLGADKHIWQDRLAQMQLKWAGLGFTPAADVLVVGCGFGWTLEEMINAGLNRAWGTDISPFIQASKATESAIPAKILSVDVTSPTARTDFVAAGAGRTGGPAAERGKFDWIVTELVLESIDPTNRTAFLDALDSLLKPGGRVGHLIVAKEPGDGPFDPTLGMIAMTLAEWVAVRPAHYWVDVEQNRWAMGGGV